MQSIHLYYASVYEGYIYPEGRSAYESQVIFESYTLVGFKNSLKSPVRVIVSI